MSMVHICKNNLYIIVIYVHMYYQLLDTGGHTEKANIAC